MKIGYFTNIYPKTSHTFIRREIKALESMGFEVVRLALHQSPDPHVNTEDILEDKVTTHLLSRSNRLPLLKWAFLGVLSSPWRFLTTTFGYAFRRENSLATFLKSFAYGMEAIALKHLSRRLELEHIHVHFGMNPATVGLLMRRMGGPPFSFTVHGPSDFDAPRELALREKVEAAEFVVAISNYCVAQLRRWAQIKHWHKIHIIGCTIDDAFLAGKPIISNTGELLFVGRLAPQKGLMTLIEAIGIAAERGSPAQVRLVGDGPLRSEIEQRVKELGLGGRVQLLGWRSEEEIRTLLAESSGFLLPSYGEGLPVVIMEAMAASRPVITTYIAGVPELVVEGVNGWLVPPADVHALAKAIQEFAVASAEELNALGTSARERVMTRHVVDTEIPKLARLFESSAPRPSDAEGRYGPSVGISP